MALDNNQRGMSDIIQGMTHVAYPAEQWPKVTVWETDCGRVAIVQELDSSVLLFGGKARLMARYLPTVMTDSFGPPVDQLWGKEALQFLSNLQY